LASVRAAAPRSPKWRRGPARRRTVARQRVPTPSCRRSRGSLLQRTHSRRDGGYAR
jgi:hypothetical protein